MSLSILFNSIQVVPSALNRKMLRFKQIGIISVVVHIICGIIAIILAYIGFSYYTLVINGILTGLFTFIAYYILHPVNPSFRIEINSIRKIARFSIFQFLFQFFNYFARNTDNLLIGKYFSSSALGFYDRSYKLMRMPVQNLTYVITPVLLPILSKYQDDKTFIYNVYYKIVKLLAIIGFPLSIFLFFSGSEIIYIVYGSQWDQSIPIFRLLSLLVGIYMIMSTTGSIFQITNRTDLLFYAGVIGSGLIVGGVAYGIFIGKDLVSIGYGLIFASIFNFAQAFYMLIEISLKKSLKEFLKVFIFPVILSLSIALALYLISMIAVKGIIFSLILKAVVSVLVFGIILRSSKKNYEFMKEYSIKILKREKK
jgi:PST family polysaccharide transporter